MAFIQQVDEIDDFDKYCRRAKMIFSKSAHSIHNRCNECLGWNQYNPLHGNIATISLLYSIVDVLMLLTESYGYSIFYLHMELILWTSMDLLKYGIHRGWKSCITVLEECFSKILNMEEVESVHVIWKKCSTSFSEILLVESFAWSVHKLQP